MTFSTQVDTLCPLKARLSHADGVLAIGSCFTEAIGGRLRENLFATMVNPFGVVYNPAAIAAQLNLLLDAIEGCAVAPLVVEYMGMFQVPMADTRCRGTNRDALIERFEQCRADAVRHIEQTMMCGDGNPTLFITLGTNHVYSLIPARAGLEEGEPQIVANCQKLPSNWFKEYEMAVDAIVIALRDVIRRFQRICPRLRVVLTVSPYRYAKYGFHENQLAKSTLLLACQGLATVLPDMEVAYFPAYEIVLDELRDYRYYAADMLHVSSITEQYIWDRFLNDWLTPEAVEACQQLQAVLRAKRHHMGAADTPEAKAFVARLQEMADAFHAAYPALPHPLTSK